MYRKKMLRAVLFDKELIQRVLLVRENYSGSRDCLGKHHEIEKVSQCYIVTVEVLSTHVQKLFLILNVCVQPK